MQFSVLRTFQSTTVGRSLSPQRGSSVPQVWPHRSGGSNFERVISKALGF